MLKVFARCVVYMDVRFLKFRPRY